MEEGRGTSKENSYVQDALFSSILLLISVLQNEHICATAIYYHSCSNITDSSLGFRQVISDDAEACIDYGQDDHAWLETIFGCAQGEPKVQVMGAVKTLEGRLITFPNILHHRVGRFKLADRTKSATGRLSHCF
jgi:hypothetical protein